MPVLDKNKPFAVIYGSPSAKYEQGGVQFNAQGLPVASFSPPEPPPWEDLPEKALDMEIPTDQLQSAKAFLTNVLSKGPVSKSSIYKAAETNNQVWDWVKKAADSLKLVKFQYQKMETWKLPQED